MSIYEARKLAMERLTQYLDGLISRDELLCAIENCYEEIPYLIAKNHIKSLMNLAVSEV